MMRLQRDDTGDSLLNNGPRSEYVKKYPEHPIGQRAKSFKPQQEIQGAVGPIESLTSQKKDYQEYPIEKRRAFRPTNERVELEPFDGHTSHRDEYPEWELPRKREIARQPWNPPEVPLDTTTSQRHDYPEHPTARRENFKPSHSPKDAGRFEGHTSNRDDYLEWQLPEKHKRATIQWQPPEVPMDANTTNKHDFQEHQISPRVQYRADYQPVNGEMAPFAGNSDYKETFKAHAIPPKHQRQKAEWTKPVDPFDATTTMSKDFQGVYQPRQASMRPTAVPVTSDVPLDTHTTMATSYQPHAVEKRYKFVGRQNNYEPPQGDMETTTTNMANYREHRLNKPAVVRPTESHLLQGRGEMAKDTTTSYHFKQPPPMKRELVRRKDTYQAPTVPIESTTSNSLAYKEHEVTPRKNFKPTGDYLKSEQPFKDNTENKDRFTQPQLPPRYIREREEHKPPSAAFEGRTTTHESYLGAYQPKRGSFRPNREAIQTDVPFQSDTTFASSYKPVKTEQRYRHQPEQYVKPDGYMDLNTVNSLAYQEVKGERRSMRKLGDNSLLTAAGKFEDRTSYTSDFVPKDMSNRQMIKPDNAYNPPNIPFDNTTTYRNSHIGYVAPKEHSKRPQELSDVLLQRDQGNKFHIRGDWRDQLMRQTAEPVGAA